MEEKSFRYENASGERLITMNTVRSSHFRVYSKIYASIKDEMMGKIRGLRFPNIDYFFVKVEANTKADLDGMGFMIKAAVDCFLPEKIRKNKKAKSGFKVTSGLGLIKDDTQDIFRGYNVQWNPNLKEGTIKFTIIYKPKI